jgi:hypothetical protein
MLIGFDPYTIFCLLLGFLTGIQFGMVIMYILFSFIRARIEEIFNWLEIKFFGKQIS